MPERWDPRASWGSRKMLRAKQGLFGSYTGIKNNEEIKARSGWCNVDRWQGKQHCLFPVFLPYSGRDKDLQAENLQNKHDLEKTSSKDRRGGGKEDPTGTKWVQLLRPDESYHRVTKIGIGVTNLFLVLFKEKEAPNDYRQENLLFFSWSLFLETTDVNPLQNPRRDNKSDHLAKLREKSGGHQGPAQALRNYIMDVSFCIPSICSVSHF